MLPRLRMTLDFMPSPFEDKPGLVIRDPFHFSDATLIVPPALVECLEYFDGQHSALDLRAHLVQIIGLIKVMDGGRQAIEVGNRYHADALRVFAQAGIAANAVLLA